MIQQKLNEVRAAPRWIAHGFILVMLILPSAVNAQQRMLGVALGAPLPISQCPEVGVAKKFSIDYCLSGQADSGDFQNFNLVFPGSKFPFIRSGSILVGTDGNVVSVSLRTTGDRPAVDRFLQEQLSVGRPSKTLDYREEVVELWPLSEGAVLQVHISLISDHGEILWMSSKAPPGYRMSIKYSRHAEARHGSISLRRSNARLVVL